MISSKLAGVGRALRTLPGIALALVLITGSRGGPAPVFADGEVDSPVGPRPVLVDPIVVPQEPAARIQVIIKSVDVVNDRESWIRGDADVELTVNVWRCTGPNPPCSASDTNEATMLLEDKPPEFHRGEGDSITLNRVLPTAGDEVNGPQATVDGGIAVFDGQTYLLQINGFEDDGDFGGDFMGGVQRIIKADNDWAVGTYTREVAAPFQDTSPPSHGGFCAGCGDIIVGDYLVTYQILFAALPDMHPKTMRVEAPGGPNTKVCATIENLGSETAEAYGMIFTIDDKTKSQIAVNLGASKSQDACVDVDPLALGSHTLSVSVDPDRAIPEANERNNIFSRDYVHRVIDDIVSTTGVLETSQASDSGSTGGDPGSDTGDDTGGHPDLQKGTPLQGITTTTTGTGVTTPAAKPDLHITSIGVKGNDCDPGKNDVAVVLKNQGSGPAENLTVQLIVDGKDKDAPEKSVQTLTAGQEQTVTFDDVDLKSDDHTLQATVESKKAGVDADASKADLKVTVTCKNEKDDKD